MKGVHQKSAAPFSSKGPGCKYFQFVIHTVSFAVLISDLILQKRWQGGCVPINLYLEDGSICDQTQGSWPISVLGSWQ